MERYNKLESVERENKLELEAFERRNKLEQRRLAAEIELRKAKAIDQILNDKESFRSRSARSSCKTSFPDGDRPVSSRNNSAAANDILTFKYSVCLQPSIVQIPSQSQTRTSLYPPVSVDEGRANLSHKANDCSLLGAIVEYMSMPKLNALNFIVIQRIIVHSSDTSMKIFTIKTYLVINKNLLICFKIFLEGLMMIFRIVYRCSLL